MKRLEFIRNSIMAAAGLLILPDVVKVISSEPQIELVEADQVRRFQFKMTGTALNNSEMFALAIKNVIDDVDRPLIETQVGFMNDDFVHDMYTVQLTFA